MCDESLIYSHKANTTRDQVIRVGRVRSRFVFDYAVTTYCIQLGIETKTNRIKSGKPSAMNIK